MRDYRVFGLHVQSELDLPAAPVALNGQPDVIVRSGTVPSHLSPCVDGWEGFEIAPGRFLMTIEGVGRWFVRDGCEIVVQADPHAPRERVEAYLCGSAFGALLQQRGLFTLHASSVAVGGLAVAFAGASGSGKSTVAAAMYQRRHDLIADDLSAFRFTADGGAVTAPGLRRIKLPGDSASTLQLAPPGTPGTGDEVIVTPRPIAPLDLKVGRIYVMGRRHRPAQPEITLVTADVKVMLLKTHTFRHRFLNGLDRTLDHFRQCVALSESVEVYYVSRPAGLAGLPALVDALERHIDGIVEASVTAGCRPGDTRSR